VYQAAFTHSGVSGCPNIFRMFTHLHAVLLSYYFLIHRTLGVLLEMLEVFLLIILPSISYGIVALVCATTGYPRPPFSLFFPLAFFGLILGFGAVMAVIFFTWPVAPVIDNLFFGGFPIFFVVFLVLTKKFNINEDYEEYRTTSWPYAIFLSISCALPTLLVVIAASFV
jgi:hypothetical protein